MRNLNGIAERTIKPPANRKVLLHNNGETGDIIRVILKTAPVSLEDTRDFIPYIRSDNVYNTCRRIWHFLKNNIKYQIDPSGDQYIQTPAYTWQRKKGDCKSYSIFISSMLKNLGITHNFRFVSFKPDDKTITHVYIVVPNKGKTIIIDVVMPEFNKEKQYRFKKDYTMAKIYQLSGIGQKPRNQGKIILNLGNKPIDKLTEGELDLLIARDRLLIEKRLVENVTGIGSVKAEKYQDSLDVINDALEAIDEYETGKIPDIEDEIGMIIEDAENGDYALAREIVGIGDIFGRRKKRKAKRKARKAKRKARRAGKKAIKKTYKGKAKRKEMKAYRKAHGTRTGKFLRKVGKTVKKGGKALLKVATAPTRLIAKGILEVYLPKAAPHFLYLFIKDEDVSKMPQAVQNKRKKQIRTANFIVNSIGMKRRHFMGIVRNGIMKRYHKSPEAVIRDQMKGKVSGIWGVVEDIAEMLGIGDIFGRRKSRRRARRKTRKTRRKTRRTTRKTQRKERKKVKGKARRKLRKEQRKVRKQVRRGRTVVSTRGTGQKAAYQSLLSIRDNINKTLKGKSIKISQDDAPDPDDWGDLIVKKEAAKKRVETKKKAVDKTKEIINRIPEAGPYFLYLFIKDIEIVKKLPATVREKRKSQERVAEYMIQSLGISRNQFMALLRKGIKADFKKEPETILAEQMKGKISGINAIAAGTGAIKALLWIINKIVKIFKKKKIDVSESDAPGLDDWGTLTDEEKGDLTADLEDQFDMEEEFADGGSIWDTLKF